MKLILKVILYGSGSLFLILGILLTGFWQHLFRYILGAKLILINSDFSQTYNSWSNSDGVPVYFKVYMFNWTNPENVMNGEKPKLDEVGPYVYRLRQIKDEIKWNSNSTVTFRDRREWQHVPEESIGSLDDQITSINAVALTLVDMCRHCSKVEKLFLNTLLKYNEKYPYTTYSVEEVLFDGASDKMLSMISKLKKFIKSFKDLPDKFAWYLNKNMTEANTYNIYTGQSDLEKLGLLHSWNHKTKCGVYNGECDTVRGSLGDLWPMNAAEQEEAPLFIADFCSNFPLKKIGPNSVYDVMGTKFEGTKELFDAGNDDAATSCYCPDNRCDFKPGVRNVSACVKAPVFVSFPHFYLADPSYRQLVSGLKPDPAKHKFHFTLQQDSGILIDIKARLQINAMVEPVPGFDFIKLPKIFLPIMWFEESVEMPPDLIAQLQFTFNTLPSWLSTGGLILTILGSILLVTGLIITRLNFDSIPYTRRLE